MWEYIKNDPILRAVTIILLGVLAFGFAFNIVFGSANGGMEHGMGSSYSYDSTLGYLLNIALKLFILLLVIAVIIAVFRLIKYTLLSGAGGDYTMFETIKKDPVLKTVSIIVLIILAIGLIQVLLSGINGFGNGNMMGNGYYGVGFSITAILVFLLKLLLFVSVVGLIVGLLMYFFKDNSFQAFKDKFSSIKRKDETDLTCQQCNTKVNSIHKYCPECGINLKEECGSCGAVLKQNWKCCPECGTEKARS